MTPPPPRRAGPSAPEPLSGPKRERSRAEMQAKHGQRTPQRGPHSDRRAFNVPQPRELRLRHRAEYLSGVGGRGQVVVKARAPGSFTSPAAGAGATGPVSGY